MTTVLIVDDEGAVSELLRDLLMDLGYSAVTALNGQQALDLIERMEERPALILTDVMMPLVSGIELVRAVRAMPELASVPIIMMSAAPAVADGLANAFVSKPFDIDRLIALLLAYLPSADPAS